MTLRLYRLMRPYGRFSIEDYTWTKPVEGLRVSLPMTYQDYIELYVDGYLLKEDVHYTRVIETEARGVLWTDKFVCPADSWAIIKIYKCDVKKD